MFSVLRLLDAALPPAEKPLASSPVLLVLLLAVAAAAVVLIVVLARRRRKTGETAPAASPEPDRPEPKDK